MEKFAIAVKGLIMNEYQEYLILKKTKKEAIKDIELSRLDLPGGRVHYQEELKEAFIRELYEETQISINASSIHPILSAETVLRSDGLHLIVITYLVSIQKQQLHLSKEHEAYHWQTGCDGLPDWIKNIIQLHKAILQK